MKKHRAELLLLVVTTICGTIGIAHGEDKAVPDGRPLNDARHGALKDLNGYFPFEVPETKEAWEQRADFVRRQLLVSQGLWPLPFERTTPKATVHGRMQPGDYSVEKVYVETMPGYFLTGNLYRPLNKADQKSPGVLCPHGHWANGRFYDSGAQAQQQLDKKAEEFPEAAHSPLQARCVHLARLGCVVFHYDMVGYADNTQISYELAHRFDSQRADMNSATDWGLFSPQAESFAQNVMGLQTWNSLRAFDFLQALPDVDSERMAVTGASGGGTQTFMLAAVEPRIKVAMPCVMVSTAMQGGCTCENSSCLRVNTGNIELAGLFAPRPLGLTSANDWTKEISTKGFPQLQQLYALLGEPDNVMLHDRTEFNHNYNGPSRKAMYRWFNKHLNLGHEKPDEERSFKRLTKEEMTVWNDEHPQPVGGDDFERSLLKTWHSASKTKLDAAYPKPGKPESAGKFRELVGGAAEVIVGRKIPGSGDVDFTIVKVKEKAQHSEVTGLIVNSAQEKVERIPTVVVRPKEEPGQVVLWIHPDGKSSLFANGKPREFVRTLIEQNTAVVGIDLLFQGESQLDGKPLQRTRKVVNPRQAAAYTFGYNHSVFIKRVHDILSAIGAIKKQMPAAKIHLVALNGAGHWGAVALSQAGDAIQDAAIDTGGFRFASVTDIHDPNFVPCGAKYFDIPGFVALSQVNALWLAGDQDASHLTSNLMHAEGETGNTTRRLETFVGKAANRERRGLQWLLNPAARNVF